MILIESNKDIDFLIKNLDSLVIELRKLIIKYPKRIYLKELLKRAGQFYKYYIISWMEQYPMDGIEVDRNEDEELKNKILDLANQIV